MAMKLQSQRNFISMVLSKLKSITREIIKICMEYFESLQNNKSQKGTNLLLIVFNNILRYCLKILLRIFGTFYWLLAPNMLIKLGIRHIILFSFMFACPSIIRLTIKPCCKWIRYNLFLKIIMGKEWVMKYRQIRKQCYECSTYKEYAECVSKLDEMEGLHSWRVNRYSSLYSHKQIHQDLLQLSKLRQNCENYMMSQTMTNIDAKSQHPMRELMEFIRIRMERNYGGIANPKLYSITKIGTKKLIEDFIHAMCESLNYIANTFDDTDISLSEKLVFFNEIRHNLGRTALCLSGGGGLGAYHIGVVLAMHRNDLLPNIITGSSVGSLISSFVCTKIDDELHELPECILNVEYFQDLTNHNFISKVYVLLKRMWKTRHFHDVKIFRDNLRASIGDITFLEAYHKTGRILNITVSGTDANTMPRLLNYLTSPNVLIWSAVVASCAVPFVFEPQELYSKSCTDNNNNKIKPIYLQGVTFNDGSISHDLPMNKLSQLFNVDNFIVSQVNPHLVPLLFHSIVAPIPLFQRLFRFLGHEFRLYLTTILVNLREFEILKGFVFINQIFTQKYTGDITIVPDVKRSDYFGLLSNPTSQYIHTCSEERSTWKHISRLKGLCVVEFTIDECLNHLRSQLLIQRTPSFHRKISRIASFQAPTKHNKRKYEKL